MAIMSSSESSHSDSESISNASANSNSIRSLSNSSHSVASSLHHSSSSSSSSDSSSSSSSSASESGITTQEALIASLFSVAKLCASQSDFFSHLSDPLTSPFAEDDSSISHFKDRANISSALFTTLALTAQQLQPYATLDTKPFDDVIEECTHTYTILHTKIRYIMDADRSKLRYPVGYMVLTPEPSQTLQEMWKEHIDEKVERSRYDVSSWLDLFKLISTVVSEQLRLLVEAVNYRILTEDGPGKPHRLPSQKERNLIATLTENLPDLVKKLRQHRLMPLDQPFHDIAWPHARKRERSSSISSSSASSFSSSNSSSAPSSHNHILRCPRCFHTTSASRFEIPATSTVSPSTSPFCHCGSQHDHFGSELPNGNNGPIRTKRYDLRARKHRGSPIPVPKTECRWPRKMPFAKSTDKKEGRRLKKQEDDKRLADYSTEFSVKEAQELMFGFLVQFSR